MRIALVNDLRICLEAMRRVVENVPGYTVAWTAANGREAVERCLADRPDVILMDLIMPEMDGAEATREIMARCPCPILVVTASVSINAGKVYEAMGYGALDAVRTPTLGPGAQLDGGKMLLAKIQRVAMLTGKLCARDTRANLFPPPAAPPDGAYEFPALLALGASTGGPQALGVILAALPQPFPAAIAIVQHVDAEFGAGLASWLSQRVGFEVVPAVAGRRLEVGKAHLAVTDDHLVVDRSGRIVYTPVPQEAIYRPSVDVFFDSLAERWPTPGAAALLTGMGRDGAAGLKRLRARGWRTLAQGPNTSVVYGMPKAAAENGGAGEVLELPELAAALAAHFQAASRA